MDSCIYPPSEDTFLLIDAIVDDRDFMQRYFMSLPSLFVEIGVGSGTVTSQVAASCFDDHTKTLYLGTDIQYPALHRFQQFVPSVATEKQRIVEVVQGDLLTFLRPMDEWVCIFNPPYVATEEEEYWRGQHQRSDIATWAGGILGRQLVDRFCQQLCEVTRNSRRVLLYLLLVDTNQPTQVMQFLQTNGNFCTLEINHRRVGWESIRVYRCWKRSLSVPNKQAFHLAH